MPRARKPAAIKKRPASTSVKESTVDIPAGIQQEVVDGYEGALVPRTRVIAALVNEIARSRVRHRALLDLLEQSGSIEIRQYIERYKALEETDFLPFVDLLLLSTSEFKEKNGDWLEKSTERFGYDGASRPHVHLTGPSPEPPMKRVSHSRKKTN